MFSRILLLSQNDEDQKFANELASVMKCSVVLIADWSELPSLLSLGHLDLFLIDVSTEQDFETYVQHATTSAAQVHLIVNSELSSIPASLQSEHCRSFLIRTYGNFEETAKAYSRLITIASSSHQEKFAIEDLLKSPSEVNQVTLTHSDQKIECLNQVREYLIHHAVISERIVEIILNGLDEILMNAIYDAPVDENGNQRLTKIPRNTPIALDEKNQVELHTVYDGQSFAFKVVDHFGSVNQLKLLKHIFLGSQDHLFQMNEAIANAGVGLASTFRMGASLMFISKKGIRTEVVVYFKLCSSFREFKNQFRFLAIHGS